MIPGLVGCWGGGWGFVGCPLGELDCGFRPLPTLIAQMRALVSARDDVCVALARCPAFQYRNIN